MSFPRNQDSDPAFDAMPPLALLGPMLKMVAFLVLLGVGLKLTFWAVDVIDEILHRPHEVAILRPLLESGSDSGRSVTIEQTGDSVTVRDHNALSLFLLVGLLLVLLGAVGRAIAAMISGAVRLLLSIDFKRQPPANPEP